MSHGSKSPGLFRRWLARPLPDELDAADLGTCIGLEMSLDQPEDPLPEASVREKSPGWVRRLTARARHVE